MIRRLITWMNQEDGHAGTLPGLLVAAAGAVILGIGACADDLGWLAFVGGIVLGVGIIAAAVMDHMVVDYDIFARLEKLEGK
jgi:hypothetical protein